MGLWKDTHCHRQKLRTISGHGCRECRCFRSWGDVDLDRSRDRRNAWGRCRRGNSIRNSSRLLGEAAMQECTVIPSVGFVPAMSVFISGLPILARALIVLSIFLAGYLEAALKLRRSALITWFWGLAVLVACIAYPWTAGAIAAGAVVLALGLGLLIAYYRSWKADGRGPRS